MATAAASAATPMTAGEKKVIFASSLGTVFEWYDFYLYGSLAPIIAKQFFAGLDPQAAFIASLMAFAAGFIVRPFGALVFGRLGDMIGRKYTFLVTILAYVFEWKRFEALAPLSAFAALISLVCELLFITLDLGRFERIYRFVLTPNPQSLMFWMFVLVNAMGAIYTLWRQRGVLRHPDEPANLEQRPHPAAVHRRRPAFRWGADHLPVLCLQARRPIDNHPGPDHPLPPAAVRLPGGPPVLRGLPDRAQERGGGAGPDRQRAILVDVLDRPPAHRQLDPHPAAAGAGPAPGSTCFTPT